ncbi:MAG: Rpn family recombination-promoting nuclease/putative transposase [Selenomonas bovis]|nr:Rpn family recombination-promoting nuclease/putative transposase [Selenomonas bovis]
MKAKRTYKDSLFRNIFNNKARLRNLYEALSGRKLAARDIHINTLRGTFFSDIKNDISFCAKGRLVVLIEQQSTWNPNMPLRFLWYLAKLYRRQVPRDMQYHIKLVPLETPEFYVLYNGRETEPLYQVLRLEDAFEETPAGDSLLRLDVPCYNLNAAPGNELLDRCYELRSYSVFVAKVREGKDSGMTLDTAVIAAMRYCITHDLMADYFKENESEVLDMVSAKWDWNEALRVAREDAAEMAREEGMEKGRWTTLAELVHKGILTLKDAAKMAGMTEDKFRKLAAL